MALVLFTSLSLPLMVLENRSLSLSSRVAVDAKLNLSVCASSYLPSPIYRAFTSILAKCEMKENVAWKIKIRLARYFTLLNYFTVAKMDVNHDEIAFINYSEFFVAFHHFFPINQSNSMERFTVHAIISIC